MSPGLTSAGGRLPEEDLQPGSLVLIMAEGKETACAVGILKQSVGEIKSVNKGIAIENVHCLADGIWTAGVEH